MIDEVYDAFLEYQIQSCRGLNNNEVDGLSGFVFLQRKEMYTPESINRAIHRIKQTYFK
ncbi:MAG: hypothetical protein WBI07_07225 [Mobilitalea sp.]